LRVFVDWVGDYEPLWELLENMPISIRNLKKKNVNESAAFITSYHEPHIDAPVNPGFVKNESGGPYLLDSLDRQYMYNRKYSPQTLK